MVHVIVNPVNFQAPAGGGASTIADPNGPGVAPKAVVFIVSGHTNLTSLNVAAPRGRISIGMTDFTTHRVVSCSYENNVAAASAGAWYRIDNATVVNLPVENGPSLEVEAAVTSVGVDSVELTWSAASTFFGIALFIYGGDVQAVLEVLASNASNGGTATSTALGREPDMVIAASCGVAFSADGSGQDPCITYGMMARHSATQGCISVCAETDQNPTSSGSILRDNAILALLSSAAGVVTEGPRVSLATTSTGFQITTTGTGSFEGMYLSLYLGGAKCWVGTPSVGASATGPEVISGVGFRAKCVLAAALRQTATNSLATGQNTMSIGFSDAVVTGTQGCWARDNVATSETNSIASQTWLIGLLANSLSFDWVASMTSIDATTFTINVDDAAAADRVVLFAAIGEFKVTVPGVAERAGRSVRAGWRARRAISPGGARQAVTLALARLTARRAAGRVRRAPLRAGSRARVFRGLTIMMLRYLERQRRAAFDRLFPRKKLPMTPIDRPEEAVEQRPKGVVVGPGLRRGLVR